MLPPGSPGRRVVVSRAFAETAVLLALGGETAGLAVLVDGVADPVDPGVAADGLVRWAAGWDGEGDMTRGWKGSGTCQR